MRDRWRKSREPRPQPSSAALAIENLLIHDPEGWVRGPHVWHHPHSGVCIWVANKDHGLHWWVGDPQRHGGPNPPEIDQQTVWNAMGPMLQWVSNDVAARALEALRTAPTRKVSANVVRLN